MRNDIMEQIFDYFIPELEDTVDNTDEVEVFADSNERGPWCDIAESGRDIFVPMPWAVRVLRKFKNYLDDCGGYSSYKTEYHDQGEYAMEDKEVHFHYNVTNLRPVQGGLVVSIEWTNLDEV
jgi:hypothetical protein